LLWSEPFGTRGMVRADRAEARIGRRGKGGALCRIGLEPGVDPPDHGGDQLSDGAVEVCPWEPAHLKARCKIGQCTLRLDALFLSRSQV